MTDPIEIVNKVDPIQLDQFNQFAREHGVKDFIEMILLHKLHFEKLAASIEESQPKSAHKSRNMTID